MQRQYDISYVNLGNLFTRYTAHSIPQTDSSDQVSNESSFEESEHHDTLETLSTTLKGSQPPKKDFKTPPIKEIKSKNHKCKYKVNCESEIL